MLIHWEGKYLIPSTPFSSIHVIKKAIQFTLVSCANLGVFFMAVCITRCRGHGSFPLFEKDLGIIISPLVGRRLALGSICVIIKKVQKSQNFLATNIIEWYMRIICFQGVPVRVLWRKKKQKPTLDTSWIFCVQKSTGVFFGQNFFIWVQHKVNLSQKKFDLLTFF